MEYDWYFLSVLVSYDVLSFCKCCSCLRIIGTLLLE